MEEIRPLEEDDPELGELIRLYVNGELYEVPEVGRNELCLCKSGKKYKHCHGET